MDYSLNWSHFAYYDQIEEKLEYHFQWADTRDRPFSEHFMPEDTIRDVKERICSKISGLQWTDINLALGGSREYLNNKDTLLSCNIGPVSRIIITSTKPTAQFNTVPSSGAPITTLQRGEMPGPGEFQVFVKTLEGRSIAIWINRDSSVGDLKTEVQRMTGIGISEQRLIYSGKQLDNIDQKLREYNVQKHCNINLVGRLKGGAGKVE
jgi:Ubiquitin family